MKRSPLLSAAPPTSSRPSSTIQLPSDELSVGGEPGAGPAEAAATAATDRGDLGPATGSTGRLLRIHEASELVGLTPRSIRYYEEVGLLRPSARSQGAYRLYDESDVERLRFIKGLRDDAGFSLAEIGRLLEAESGRQRAREAFEATHDPVERREILDGGIAHIDVQVATLQEKIGRLHAMIEDAQRRRAGLETLLAGLEEAR